MNLIAPYKEAFILVITLNNNCLLNILVSTYLRFGPFFTVIQAESTPLKFIKGLIWYI